MVQQDVANADIDTSWRGFYRIGGISAILYLVLSLFIPTIMVLFSGYFSMNDPALLLFIAENKLWWLTLQTLVLGTSFLAIITFIALYLALRALNRTYALLGTALTVTCELLFMAYYPVLLGLSYLGDKYPSATEEERTALMTAANALLAQNNAFNPLYESLFAAGILILSLAMLKGDYPKYLGYVGIACLPAAIIAMLLWPLIGVNYFWWWIFFFIWFAGIGWKLLRLGRQISPA